jgi:hypothetical protein
VTLLLTLLFKKLFDYKKMPQKNASRQAIVHGNHLTEGRSMGRIF